MFFFIVRLLTMMIFANISQKLKTRVIKKTTNPEWNDELTLSIEDPAVPVRLVYIPFLFHFALFFLVVLHKQIKMKTSRVFSYYAISRETMDNKHFGI